jgi:2-polyprenyl-3-methyl-5-hydroxy-6-metoxy-1,4-benzoquinol methylase
MGRASTDQGSAMSRIHYESCPGCGATQLAPVFIVTDHAVSGESFPIVACAACGLRFTQEVPDAQDIGRYYRSVAYVPHTESKRNLINRLFHLVRKITLRQKLRWIERASGLTRGALLDIGCGAGAFLKFMQAHGWTVTGIEPSEAATRTAQEFYGLTIRPEVTIFNLPAGQFDVLTLWHVLEHVHEVHAYLDRLHQLAKPGGVILLAVPNQASSDCRHYQADWYAFDAPRHLYHFAPESMRRLLEQHALKVETMLPMPFDAFYISLLSEQARHNPLWLFAGGWRGLCAWLAARRDPTLSSSLTYVCRVSPAS